MLAVNNSATTPSSGNVKLITTSNTGVTGLNVVEPNGLITHLQTSLGQRKYQDLSQRKFNDNRNKWIITWWYRNNYICRCRFPKYAYVCKNILTTSCFKQYRSKQDFKVHQNNMEEVTLIGWEV